MELLHRIADAAAPPRVLGLTASYANDGAKTWEEFQESRRSLEVEPAAAAAAVGILLLLLDSTMIIVIVLISTDWDGGSTVYHWKGPSQTVIAMVFAPSKLKRIINLLGYSSSTGAWY